MPISFRTTLCMLAFLCALCNRSRAQCLIAPPAPPCSGTEPLITDGETVNTSTSHWYYGPAVTFNSLTLNGGTLVVCGNLTVNNFTFNSGTLYVLSGASFTIGSGISTTLQLQGGCYIYNYGTLVVQRALALDNAHVSASQPNILINASTNSVLSIPFNWLVINNPYSWFVNNGKTDMHGIVTDPQSSPGSVCLGPGSQTAMSVLINNAPDTYSAPSGPGCVSVHDNSYLCESVTGDAGVRACLSASQATDSTCFVSRGHVKAWGSATIFKSCTACGAIATLPLSIPSFTVAAGDQSNRLEWQIEGAFENYKVRIERSADGSVFSVLPLALAGTHTGSFIAYDTQPISGRSFYRIFYSNLVTGEEIASTVKEIDRENGVDFSINPNPFVSGFFIHLPSGPARPTLELFGTDGKKVKQLYIHNTGNGELYVTTGRELPPGLYTLRLTIGNRSYLKHLVKR